MAPNNFLDTQGLFSDDVSAQVVPPDGSQSWVYFPVVLHVDNINITSIWRSNDMDKSGRYLGLSSCRTFSGKKQFHSILGSMGKHKRRLARSLMLQNHQKSTLVQ